MDRVLNRNILARLTGDPMNDLPAPAAAGLFFLLPPQCRIATLGCSFNVERNTRLGE